MAEIHSTHNHFTAEQLPVDIIHSEILPRLPAASVARFKSVSKHWHSFLSTEDFQKMHRHHARRRLLLINYPSTTYSMFDAESPTPDSTTMCSIPFRTRKPFRVLVLASLDGLLCACMQNTRELVLWNPLTRAYKKLSNSKSQGFYEPSDAVGLYKDSSNDYKILHVKRRRGGISAYVYSRGVDSWRKVMFLKNASRLSNTMWSFVAFSGKSLYFTMKDFCISGESWMVGFDVDSEKFRQIRFPSLPYGSIYYLNLMEVENSIQLCVSYGKEEDISLHSELHLWRFMESGDNWMKVASFPSVQNVPWSMKIENCYGKWLVIRGWSRALHVMDMINSDDKICWCHSNWFHTLDEPVIYIETLVSPNQTNSSEF